MQKAILIFILFISVKAFSQDKPFIHLQQPSKEKNIVFASQQFIVGAVCKTFTLTINDTPVKVYSTGGFAYELNLNAGDTAFTLVSSNGDQSFTKKISYSY